MTELNQCFAGIYRGKRVLVTGHTGFKGAWLSEWLLQLGAEVTGFALAPPTKPSLFEQVGLDSRLRHIIGDVRDLGAVQQAIDAAKPDFVFHLAAQPLVRLSYTQPVKTYATNVMGTAHVLEAVRLMNHPCVVVAITTDKCYENREWIYSYREEDHLGGYDPYSSSKGAAELVIASYRKSFFSALQTGIRVASARAGNVIGGGDWAEDRIVPDCIRALQRGESVPVRNKFATRPWVHVLEPLSGYLWLGALLAIQGDAKSLLASAFNFGPSSSSSHTVEELVQKVLKYWPGRWEDRSNPNAVHEATSLHLATDKACRLLKWQSLWDFEETVARTAMWYRQAHHGADVAQLSRSDIYTYVDLAASKGLCWAK